jgi:hypothetical protein
MHMPGNPLCPHCGADLPVKAKFCPECGKEVIVALEYSANPDAMKTLSDFETLFRDIALAAEGEGLRLDMMLSMMSLEAPSQARDAQILQLKFGVADRKTRSDFFNLLLPKIASNALSLEQCRYVAGAYLTFRDEQIEKFPRTDPRTLENESAQFYDRLTRQMERSRSPN